MEISPSALSSDTGLLPVRQFDERIGLTSGFAAALRDTRDPTFTKQSLLDMVRQRIYGIIADYEDQNDHDTLRSDPVFKLIAGRLPGEEDLASQPTLSRFENAVSIADLWQLRDEFAERFIQSFNEPPLRITLDLDAFDDPTHGRQQLTMFHGYYDQYQYLPIIITCAENDAVVLIGLRHGTCHASLGADDDLRYLVGHFRAVWPDVQIVIRADSGFATPVMYDVCEELGLTFTIGLGMNPRLKKLSDSLLEEAIQTYAETGQPQRLFLPVEYQADTWPRPRSVVIKVEVHAQGTNRRAVVTNRPGWQIEPQGTYDEYAARGESENRNKELKRELKGDRLSDHRFLANFFRLYLHAAALNLMVRLRQAAALPEKTPRQLGLHNPLPAELLDEPDRKRFFNRRREHDPLGEGFACTWRTRLIKVAAEVIVSARRVLIRLSGTWPYLDHFQRVSRAVLGVRPAPSG
jgi:hypothetical protein